MKERPEWDLNSDLCDAGAVLYHAVELSGQLGADHYVGL